MSLVINNNMMAANTARTLNQHYGRLAQSTQRLSTGLRVNSAADDAAGLAIRELQRAEIAALHQGSRNANDAISLIQTADGALGIIDEKLIRMKELAEQAATGTYDSTQRLMIASEFVAMGSEINRIANATDFNGIKLLDGSLQGAHDGSGLVSKGALKVHFGSSNSSMEDYYYIGINDSTLVGLGLATPILEKVSPPTSIFHLGNGKLNRFQVDSGIISVAYIPKGATDVRITIDNRIQDDDIQIFTRDGYHILGTKIDNNPNATDATWAKNGVNTPTDVSIFYTKENGFNDNITYKLPDNNADLQGTFLDGNGMLHNIDWDDLNGEAQNKNDLKIDLPNRNAIRGEFNRAGSPEVMNFIYSTDGDWVDRTPNNGIVNGFKSQRSETVFLDKATEDLLINISGQGVFDISVSWSGGVVDPGEKTFVQVGSIPHTIETQEAAQQMLEKIDAAIVKKDKIRAHLGALQNRLENTISNLNIQAENLQAAESRISDVDVATEMTEFVRNQILTQSAVAMLSQANSLPQMAMQLIGG